MLKKQFEEVMKAFETQRNVVFVPITFCWFCGNRENKFEWKLITI